MNGNETEIHEVDFLLRGVQIPKGQGEIVMVFEPYSYQLGSVMAYFASFILIVGGITIFYQRKL